MRQQQNTEKFTGNNLTAAIRRRGLDQREVALKLDVKPSAVSNWCNGRNQPKGKHLRKLVDLLGQPADFLLDDVSYLSARPTENKLQETSNSEWRERAEAAELRISSLRSGLESLLDMLNSDRGEEARAVIRAAEAVADREAAAPPSAQKPAPSSVALPGSNS